MTNFSARRQLGIHCSAGIHLRRICWCGAQPAGPFEHQSPLGLDPPLTDPTVGCLPQQPPTQMDPPAGLTQREVQRSASATTSETAQGGRSASSLMPAGMQAVELCTQPRHAPCGLPLANEFQRAHSPLRRSGFERELRNYPDKAFVTWLLDAIDNGVSIGTPVHILPILPQT